MDSLIRPQYENNFILFSFCGFQFRMLNRRRQTPAYDSRYKGWRGPRLESTIDETGDTESMVSPNDFFFLGDITAADF